MYAANSQALTRFQLAKVVYTSYLLPSTAFDNAHFFMPYLKFAQPDMYELFGEALLFGSQRGKIRKLDASHSPLAAITDFSCEILSDQESDVVPYEEFTVQENDFQIINDTSFASKKRKNSDIVLSPAEPLIYTTQVRRSARCNKYDGFKPKNLSEAKAAKSKVKPRKNPLLTVSVLEEEEIAKENTLALVNSSSTDATPIPVLQSIGINLCAVPPEELSPKKLLAQPQDGGEEDSA
jgi:hypothetical protein